MKRTHDRSKTRVAIYSLVSASFGVALIVLADTWGGEYLPVWVYVMIWVALFGLRYLAGDYPRVLMKGRRR